jgi:hypothetical protein
MQSPRWQSSAWHSPVKGHKNSGYKSALVDEWNLYKIDHLAARRLCSPCVFCRGDPNSGAIPDSPDTSLVPLV